MKGERELQFPEDCAEAGILRSRKMPLSIMGIVVPIPTACWAERRKLKRREMGRLAEGWRDRRWRGQPKGASHVLKTDKSVGGGTRDGAWNLGKLPRLFQVPA